MSITELMAGPVLQIGIVIFAVRFGGALALIFSKKIAALVRDRLLGELKDEGFYIRTLAAIASILRDEALREQVIDADFREDAALLLKKGC
ncbi:MAG: hypothetical protein LBU28_03780 [Spirochaetaceae bacterium]|jgi:hypothetical protein|nr:hypothetical protein [Spirochaetaceae bacterium]